MDRIDAMTAFVTTVDTGGFSAAARKLGRSAASITRAVAFLEERTGSALLRRTTRTVKLTEAGERYHAACKRILSDLESAEQSAASERVGPRGVLAVTAPVSFGRLHVRPVLDAFLAVNREARARLLLLDRVVNLIDEGVDVAVRIAHLPDSSLIAVKVGEVSRVVCASPEYLARKTRPRSPADLGGHDCISVSEGTESGGWTFASPSQGKRVHVKLEPRLIVNGVDAAIDSAIDGHGVARVLSYQIERPLGEGRLVRVLARFEPEPLPVHVVYPAASAASAKVRAFVDAAVPALRTALTAAAARQRTSRSRRRA
jgi:DNA-binding transcriptional LysR family regulator